RLLRYPPPAPPRLDGLRRLRRRVPPPPHQPQRRTPHRIQAPLLSGAHAAYLPSKGIIDSTPAESHKAPRRVSPVIQPRGASSCTKNPARAFPALFSLPQEGSVPAGMSVPRQVGTRPVVLASRDQRPAERHGGGPPRPRRRAH